MKFVGWDWASTSHDVTVLNEQEGGGALAGTPYHPTLTSPSSASRPPDLT